MILHTTDNTWIFHKAVIFWICEQCLLAAFVVFPFYIIGKRLSRYNVLRVAFLEGKVLYFTLLTVWILNTRTFFTWYPTFYYITEGEVVTKCAQKTIPNNGLRCGCQEVRSRRCIGCYSIILLEKYVIQILNYPKCYSKKKLNLQLELTFNVMINISCFWQKKTFMRNIN